MIHKIRMLDGSWLAFDQEIGKAVVQFCSGLFSTNRVLDNFDMICVILKLVTKINNSFLEVVPSIDEITKVVFNMDRDSAPGPDGFS